MQIKFNNRYIIIKLTFYLQKGAEFVLVGEFFNVLKLTELTELEGCLSLLFAYYCERVV